MTASACAKPIAPSSPERLWAQLEAIARTADADAAWQPQLYNLGDADDRAAVEALLLSGQVQNVCDDIEQQLVGLMEVRDPATDLAEAIARERLRKHVGANPMGAYGTWVYYPWSRLLVHVLPEPEYRELRTSRNRNKITFDEQERLARLRVGIVGLSIGQAAAVTLTLEHIGGYFALADFDFLELSNLNRLRSGAKDLGVNKAVLAAREIFEINPYSAVSVWTDGVTPANVDAFLHAGGEKLDLLYEECDDLQIKILVRERARHHRIPVLMETSDRGLIDIERYDLEPERPIFHGLAGDVDAASLANMTTYEKVPLVMRIIGREGMTDRMAASMVDIEATLKSWPQLASEVALGAGINANVARRIGLGELSCSGRFYVDVEKIIADDANGDVDEPPTFEITASEQAHGFELPPLTRPPEGLTDEATRALVSWGITAFSAGNCQPWQIIAQPGKLALVHDLARSENILDVDHRATYLGFGSLIENLDLACRAMQVHAGFTLFPDANDPTRICDVALATDGSMPAFDPLVRHAGSRVTNRKLGARRPLDPEHRDRMTREAASHGGRVQWLESDEDLAKIGDILGRCDRMRMVSKKMHEDSMSELRWTVDDVEQTRDGIDVATLEMTPTDVAGLRLISSWPVMKTVGAVAGGLGLQRPTRKALKASAAVGFLTVEGTSPTSFVRAGRALQRLWLSATDSGVALQPMTPLVYLFYRLERMGGEGLSKRERKELAGLRQELGRLFEVRANHAEPMLFRVGYADGPTARSLRRDVDDVLRFER